MISLRKLQKGIKLSSYVGLVEGFKLGPELGSDLGLLVGSKNIPQIVQ